MVEQELQSVYSEHTYIDIWWRVVSQPSTEREEEREETQFFRVFDDSCHLVFTHHSSSQPNKR